MVYLSPKISEVFFAFYICIYIMPTTNINKLLINGILLFDCDYGLLLGCLFVFAVVVCFFCLFFFGGGGGICVHI